MARACKRRWRPPADATHSTPPFRPRRLRQRLCSTSICFGGLNTLADIRVAGGSYFISDAVGAIYEVPPGVQAMVDPSWVLDTMDPAIPLLATAGLGTCWTKPANDPAALRCEVNGVLTTDITLAPGLFPGGLDVDNARVYYTVSIGQLASVALLDTSNLMTHATGLPTPIYGVEIRSLEAFVATAAGLYRVDLNDSSVAQVHAAPIEGRLDHELDGGGGLRGQLRRGRGWDPVAIPAGRGRATGAVPGRGSRSGQEGGVQPRHRGRLHLLQRLRRVVPSRAWGAVVRQRRNRFAEARADVPSPFGSASAGGCRRR